MHELSLAMSVLDIARDELARHPGKSLSAIEISVGEFAGVELDTFTSAMHAVVRSSEWPGAQTEIVRVSASAQCLACGCRFHPSGPWPVCPDCGSGACGIVTGNEFRVTALRIV